MPPPSPSSPKPFAVNSKFQSRPNYPDQEDVFYTPENKQDKGKERAALGLIDTNKNQTQAVASGSGSTSKVPTVYHTSIPKPPLLPDVFTPHGQKRVNDENEGEERPRKRTTNDTTTTGSNVSRARDLKAARKDVEVEQEKWRMKWIKSFPTLTFHFEVEADQGVGKGLKARATKMGAVSQFTLFGGGADVVEN
jgi:hypothetical protein